MGTSTLSGKPALLVLLIGLLIAANPSFARTYDLTLAYEDKEVYPYYLGNGTQVPENRPGISIELLRQLQQELDIKIRFTRLPWKRCKDNLKKGKVDGIFNASYSKDRLDIGYYPTIDGTLQGPPDPSKRLTTLRYNFYKKRNTPFHWNGQQVVNQGPFPVGAILGYSVVSDLKKLGLFVDEVTSPDNGLSMLLNGRLAAFADLEPKIDKLIRDMPSQYQNVEKIEPPIKVKHYYLMLSKQFVENKPEMAEKIWSSIEKIRNSAAYKEIEEKY